MNISRISIRNPVGITLLVILMCVLGVLAFRNLPVSDLPVSDYPVITVTASYPGANPQTMADAVATPLEQQLVRVQGLKNIISVSTDSFTKIILTFGLDCQLNEVIPDVQNAISYAKGYMPKLPDDPRFSKTNPSERPVMFMIADSDSISHDQVFQLSDKKIGQQLSMTDGVSSVTIWSVSSAIRICVDPQKMAGLGISFSDLCGTLWNSSALSSGGYLGDNARTCSIIPDGQITTPEGYNNLILKYDKDGPVRVSDIGKAMYAPQQTNYMLKYFDTMKGKLEVNPVMLSVSRKDGSNTVSLMKSISGKISELKGELPESLGLSVIYDRSSSILASMNEVEITLLCALILVISVIYFFIGRTSAALIPVVIIPVSFLTTFAVMRLMDYSIDNLSMLAFTLAAGFIVDDSIVVLENTSRYIELGLGPEEAALKSAAEIMQPVISMTAALVVVILPVLFLDGAPGKAFREFAGVSITLILTSGLLSLTITPMMCASILSSGAAGRTRIQHLVHHMMKWVMRKYCRCLVPFLKKPFLSLALWLACLVCAFLFYLLVPKNFIPCGDTGTIFGSIQLPIGVSSEKAQKFQDAVDGILRNAPDIDRFFTITGMYNGADQSTGRMAIMLKDRKFRKDMQQVMAGLRDKFAKMPYNLGEVYLTPEPVLDLNTGGETTAYGAQYSYLLTGLDRAKVMKYGRMLEEELGKQAEFKDVQSDIKLNLPQLDISIDRDKASSLGISLSDIENTLLYAYSKYRAAQYVIDSSYYDVIVEVGDKFSSTPEGFSSMYLKSSISGEMVPLSALVRFNRTSGPQSVTRYQQLAAATVSFNLSEDVPLGNALRRLEDISRKLLPPGVTGKLQGVAGEFVVSIRSLSLLILAAICLLYVVLGILYKSYVYPVVVLTTLPIAIAGALGMLLLSGFELSLFAYVGLFLLLGIIVKNGIMMIDLALRKISIEGKSAPVAIYSACLVRFRPILMTGLTSIFGAIPLVVIPGMDAALKNPLGIVIFGGLVVAQILTLFVTPGIFLLAHGIRQSFSDR